MAEILSPNAILKQRLPRIQSPTAPFILGSNDDKLERAQARAARAAAIRRKLITSNTTNQSGENSDPCLDKQQILDLFQNCIKLASENKINQKNTWELNLIDHLCEIIKVEDEQDVETNFQKASCTLEAGVKIYSLRVDSVHSEAYKVLGGINRAGQENEQDAVMGDANTDSSQEEGHSKQDTERKISHLSTLESSFESLNVKKFDAAFAVDPLYHQTSAQFDEGGAKGLLLNNLGLYGACRVLFDSQEVPGKFTSCENQHERQDTIDLSFTRDYIEHMVLNMQTVAEISPTLKIIVNQFDEDNKRPLDTFPSLQKSSQVLDKDESYNEEVDFDGNAFESGETWTCEHDEQTSVVDDEPNGADTSFPSIHEENELFSFNGPDMDDRFDKVDSYLSFSLGFTSKQNAWAGPDHWKYRKAKGLEDNSTTEEGSPVTAKKPKTKKQAELDIDFTKALDENLPDVFTPPKNPKSLLLPATRVPCSTTLPEDCHYQPEDLVKLFLLPNIMCLGKRRRRSQDEPRQHSDDYGAAPSWDDGSVFGGDFDDGNTQSDVEDPNTLVSQPRQVNKIEVQYDKTSKQVDVQALKETLWHHMEKSPQVSIQEDEEQALSFKNLLSSFPSECSAAGTIKDISPHLCFICLLHLANEHGLSIRGCASLDDLNIHLPSNNLHVN
ncbi:condensin complex subunit 2 isoform X2 [Ricinus communis]|uniref:condensin complex subunit 2 isoform X2 n=1 Tax=Ricinus communis TaxID=3988 RepID=UPI0007724C40|nr:condensin complex subunit 2 isoform X2 [Ricinus communis]|eukprot:XP_015580957.1 condensin complex subunit 2 isoform X2 [Ricinus communis]